MSSGKKPMDPQTRRSVLWFVLYMGCLLCGLAITAMFIPSEASIAPFMRVMFGLVLVLAVVLVSLAGWQLSRSITAARAGWRWAILLTAAAAGIAVGVWTAASLPVAVPVLPRLGTLVLGTLGLTGAFALGTNALVKILAAHTDVSDRPLPPPHR